MKQRRRDKTAKPKGPIGPSVRQDFSVLPLGMADNRHDADRCSMCGKVISLASATLAEVKICETCAESLDSVRKRIKEIEAKALRKLRGTNPFNAA